MAIQLEKENSSFNIYEQHFLIDSESELQTLENEYTCRQGDKAELPDGSYYLRHSDDYQGNKWELVKNSGGSGGSGDSYTKSETDALLSDKVDNSYLENNYYQKSETDTLLSDKVDNSYLENNYYQKSEIDTDLANINSEIDILDISTHETRTKTEFKAYAYVDNNGNYVTMTTPSCCLRTKWFSCNPGDKFYYKGHSQNAAKAVCFANIDHTALRAAALTISSKEAYTEVVVPENAYYILFASYNPTSATISPVFDVLNEFEYNNYIMSADALDDATEALEKANIAVQNSYKIEQVTIPEHPQLWDRQIVEGAINTSGTAQVVSGWYMSSQIPVKENYYYYLNGVKRSLKSIRCLDANGNKMKVRVASTGEEPGSGMYYYLPNEAGTDRAEFGQFKTPAGAKYVEFSLCTNNHPEYGESILLQEVGDTYNPNFIPSTDWVYDGGADVLLNKYKMPEVVSLEQRVTAIEDSASNGAPSVLLIGSSHGMNTISQLPWLFYRGGYTDVRVGNVYIGSFMIQELAQRIILGTTLSYQEFNETGTPGWGKNKGTKTMSQLLDMNWDVISLQRSASDDETWTASQAESFGYVMQYISSYCKSHNLKTPRIVFNSGFADRNTDFSHTEAIMTTAKEMQKEYGISIVPTAMALANARTTWLKEIGNTTYLCYDSQHLDYGIGCWVASACLFEAVMRPLGRSVACCFGYGTQEEQQVFISAATMENYTEPTEKTMTIAKACVLAAFEDDTNINTILSTKYQYKNNIEVFANWISIEGTNANTKSIADGASYSITLTPWSGKIVSNVIVKMDDNDITQTAYDSTTQTISINSVSGDIQIIAQSASSGS